MLNDLCRYCGALPVALVKKSPFKAIPQKRRHRGLPLPVARLKKSHFKAWMESHAARKSSATHRTVTATVLAAFNYAENDRELPNPFKGQAIHGVGFMEFNPFCT